IKVRTLEPRARFNENQLDGAREHSGVKEDIIDPDPTHACGKPLCRDARVLRQFNNGLQCSANTLAGISPPPITQSYDLLVLDLFLHKWSLQHYPNASPFRIQIMEESLL
ncbi:hypothetical protein J6590_034742, partial [Homalodisca vitripennis]